ncbi:helix-turn-helix domain-containing protein [Aquabacterium sp. A7-Y]|uniref:GlxA family transcriptional regulator n=1 Tax=Aquabacterium sp. A7-Y TaxID=1349605 RepID=UPI00223E3C3E|nr:helix-turn-helix domain-containing protein [Aquabacterium sp. A7-Y]MCW7540079.1 helix-turn-helix domain-containing protein [Aquabacterium sp. A7-Y]
MQALGFAFQQSGLISAIVWIDHFIAFPAMPDLTIAALEGVLPASLAITLDTLAAANRMAAQAGQRELSWRVVGSSASVPLGHGLSLAAEPLSPRLRLGRSVLVVPGLQLLPPEPTRGARRPDMHGYLVERIGRPDARCLAALMQAHHARGQVLAASCSSVLLMGEAGLLDGRTATTHWAIAGLLQARYPQCRVDATRMVVEDERLISAGAAMAQMDLMLLLLGRCMGHRVAERVMRYLLLDSRPSQSTYAVWSQLAVQDGIVGRIEAIVEARLPDAPGLAELAAQLHVSERTLARRVQRATGQTPLVLIQAVRLRRARHLIETTRLPLAEVAAQVGYTDPSGLHRLTSKVLRTAPGRLRPSR